jgi:hypothetical protein
VQGVQGVQEVLQVRRVLEVLVHRVRVRRVLVQKVLVHKVLVLVPVPVLVPVLVLGLVPGAFAQQRHVLIVTGASGGEQYARQYKQWVDSFSQTLVTRMKIDPSRVTTLSETDDPSQSATAANVRRVLTAMRGMGRDDLLFVLLVGHGTFDGQDAKFNLVGRDLEATEWSSLLKPLPGRVVIVNTASASFPFLERLAGPRRVIVSATDSAAQRFDTVFPEYFVKAFADDAADIDKNGRVSVWEAFAAAASGVRRHYQQRGQLSTERSLLDDNGDGVGREAAGSGDDGSLASRTYLEEPVPGAPPTDEVLLQLLHKRASLEAEVEELRIKRAFLPNAEYEKEFERLMIELARVGRDIRARQKT